MVLVDCRGGFLLLKASLGVLFLLYNPNKTEPNVKVTLLE